MNPAVDPPAARSPASQSMSSAASDHEDDGQHAGDHRDHALQAHHRVEPRDAGRHHQRRDHDQRDDLRSRPAAPPSRLNTVAQASVASTTSTVSQPTVNSHDSAAGTRFPRTPKAARESTIVGAEPRLPGERDHAAERERDHDADDARDHAPARTTARNRA